MQHGGSWIGSFFRLEGPLPVWVERHRSLQLFMLKVRTFRSRGLVLAFSSGIFFAQLPAMSSEDVRAPLRVNTQSQNSKLIHKVEPKYPELARAAGIESVVKPEGEPQAGTKVEADLIQRLKESVERNPENAGTWFLLGSAYYDEGRLPEAVRALQEAVRLKPDQAIYHTALGDALHESGKPDEAILQFLAAIRLEPGNALAHRNIGVVYFRKGDWDAAEKAFREAVRLKPDYMLARASVIDVLARKKDRGGMLNQFREALRVNREQSIQQFGKGLLSVEKEELIRAEEEAAARWLLGVSLLRIGSSETDRAKDEFKRAALLDSDLALAYQMLAVIYTANGNWKKGLETAQHALRINPSLPKAYMIVGDANRQDERFDEAVTAYRAAIQAAPNLARAHFSLGTAYGAMGQPEQAIEALQKALRVDPKFDAAGNVHAVLAVAYHQTGLQLAAWQHVHEAQRRGRSVRPSFLEKLREMAPEDEERSLGLPLATEDPGAFAIHFNRGKKLMEERRAQAATKELRQALRLHPNHANSRFFLALLFTGSENYARVWEQVRLMRQAGHEPPENFLGQVKQHMSEAQAEKELKSLAEERAALEVAVRREPERLESRLSLAELLRKELEFELAREEYEAALHIAPEHAGAHREIVRIPVESSGSGFHMLSSSGNAGNSFL